MGTVFLLFTCPALALVAYKCVPTVSTAGRHFQNFYIFTKITYFFQKQNEKKQKTTQKGLIRN